MFETLIKFMRLEKIREINARYRHAGVTMRPGSRMILFALKLYIAVFCCLLAYKFYSVLSGGRL